MVPEMYNRTTELGWGKQGPEQDRPWLPRRGTTKSEQIAFFLWAVSTTGKRTEMPNSLISPLSQAGLNAMGNTKLLRRAPTIGPLNFSWEDSMVTLYRTQTPN